MIINRKKIWSLTWPVIIANLTIPLVGLTDTIIMGHMPNSFYIASIAIGSLIFNFIYAGLNFFRMGTTGIVAQKLGEKNYEEIFLSFLRPLILSLIIGFLLVIFYMIFKYRFFGIIADISLIINLTLLLGVLTIFEATLTLPGIAGIILTVGMAVDANVLIFERIKEEIKTEKSTVHAFDIGYKKAQSAILDANITTLISAVILFFLGSGPVKGFAVTLGVGILTTLFSAYFLARHLTSIFVMKRKDKEIVI